MVSRQLSILCVTQGQPYAAAFIDDFERVAVKAEAELVLCTDGRAAFNAVGPNTIARVVEVRSNGFIESILDEAVLACRTEYILRLDDDERVSPAMLEWLQDRAYLQADHWKFPRTHLWPDENHVLMTPHLFPDHQTRLSIASKSGGRHHLHAPSPWGGGELAPVAIEHHKFLVKTYEERKAIAEKWHRGDMTAFSLPEDAYLEATVVSKGTGDVPWHPDSHYTFRMDRMKGLQIR